MDKKEEFLKKIQATFRMEAEENLDSLAAYLVELEQNVTDERKAELVEVVYRSAHSLKGASRAVNMNEIESICHASEDVMSAVRSEEIQFNSQVFDILHQTVDLLTEVLNSENVDVNEELNVKITSHIDNLSLVEAGIGIEEKDVVNYIDNIVDQPVEDEEVENEVEVPNQQLKTFTQKLSPKKPKVPNKKISETIRVSTTKLDSLLFQAEEMLALKLGAIQRTENLQNIVNSIHLWNKETLNIYSSTQVIKQLLNKKEKEHLFLGVDKELVKLLEFCEWTNSHIKNVEKELNELRNLSHQESYSTGSKIENLLDDVRELITVPFATLLNVFPKMIRDIAKDLEKQVDFEIKGDDIEIDRRILEKLRNPLMHILRNSIDYGIEMPDDRIKKNKEAKGSIKIEIEQYENNKVELLISDDGNGINLEKLKLLYIKSENIPDSDIDKITRKDCLNFIFKSGVSTSSIVTDLSGRGLGLAIVQEEIEQLGGTVEVETVEGKSTTFRILLPISIVTFRGVLLELSDKQFIVPTSKVLRVIRINKNEVKTIENKATISFDGKIIPLVNLGDILEITQKSNNVEFIQIIVFEVVGKQMGFVVDRVIGEQEVLAKNFNKQLTRVRNISGATVLGSGKIVPILNIPDLVKSALKSKGSTSLFADENQNDKVVQKSILVVEDSITSRTLLKNILESTGYLVTTAIDGLEGFTKLKEGEFDVVVSDVEMPRMNGFELTAKIRSNKKTAEIPVILITSLSKREDREKGIDAGANAYIIKSSFDQSNLLEILDRFI